VKLVQWVRYQQSVVGRICGTGNKVLSVRPNDDNSDNEDDRFIYVSDNSVYLCLYLFNIRLVQHCTAISATTELLLIIFS